MMASIRVTTFENPHLFWFFEERRAKQRAAFEKELGSSIAEPVLIDQPNINLIVLVHNDTWRRAIVKDIHSGELTCWLIDFGVYRKCRKVYRMPEKFVTVPPFAKQGALNEVVNVKQCLQLDCETIQTIHFSSGTIKRAKEHIKMSKSVFFQCVFERQQIHVGKISIVSSSGLYDLAVEMVEEKNLAFNKDLFEKALYGVLQTDTVPYMSCTLSCNKKIDSKYMDLYEELKDMEGMGRGIVRGVKLQQRNTSTSPGSSKDLSNKNSPNLLLPEESAQKEAFLDKWVQSSKDAIVTDELDLGSDNEGKESPNISTETNVGDSPSSLDRLKRMAMKLKAKNASKPSNITQNNLSLDSELDGAFSSSKIDDDVSFDQIKDTSSNTSRSKEVRWAHLSENGDTATTNTSLKLLNILPAGMMEPTKKRTPKSAHISPGSFRSTTSISQANSTTSGDSAVKNVNRDRKDLPTNNGMSSKNGETSFEFMKKFCAQGCKCAECKGLLVEDVFIDNIQFSDSSEKNKNRSFDKAPPLFKTEKESGEVVEIQSHASSLMMTTYTERSAAPKLLVHGCSVPFPTTSRAAVPFHPDVHRALRLFEQPYSIQCYTWPCLMRNINVCMVGTPRCGKTMGYIPAIYSFVLERDERYESLSSNTMSPIVVILCPGSKVAEDIFNVLHLNDTGKKKSETILAIPPLDKDCLNQFHKQCHILVTTPMVLIQLLRARLINIKRLCHFVIEGADQVLEKFSKGMDTLFTLMENMLEHRRCNLCIQMIVCAEHWTIPLENLMKRLYITPTICIASHLETALYGRADIQVNFLKAKAKMYTLAELLKDKARMFQTVVICNSDKEIAETTEYLNSAGVNCVFIYDSMESCDIIDWETKWLHTVAGKHLVLVCTDQVFNNCLNISSAVRLIHYSLPTTWTLFANRFSCLLDNYQSPLASSTSIDRANCKVHIFVDENCTLQFPKLVQFLQRMGTKFPAKFSEYYMQTIKNREEEKISNKIKLCRNLLLFGKCHEDNTQLWKSSFDYALAYSSLNCKNRHCLSNEVDCSSNFPKFGRIKFKILYVQNVTTFIVKLLEHIDKEGVSRKWDNHDDMLEKLDATMENNKVGVFDVKVGEWYAAYLDDKKVFVRCIVEKRLEINKITKLPACGYVRLLDSGIRMKVYTSYMYELPQQFKDIPAQGVILYLANMLPPDDDTSWSAGCKSKVKQILEQAGYEDPNVFVDGRILLQLGDVFWVKNLIVQETLLNINTTVTKLNLRKALQDRNLATYSETQLNGLYELCKNSNIVLPDYTELLSMAQEVNLVEQIQPQWAFFDDLEYNEVYISNVVDPDLFYVRLKKFNDLFEDLQKDIQKMIVNPLFPKEFPVEVGHCYLAKDPGSEEFARVKITELRENIANCFFVDFGDEAPINVPDLKYLPDEYISKLPFQVIECRLYGIERIFEEWSSSSINIFCDYIFEPNTNFFRTIYSSTCKEEESCKTEGDKYAVILADAGDDGKAIVINKILIDCGQAEPIEGEDFNKEFHLTTKEEQGGSDADVSSIEGIEDKDFTIEEINTLRTKYGVKNEEDAPDMIDSADHSWDIVFNDSEEFLKELYQLTPTKARTNSSPPTLPPITALPSCAYSTPDVVWHQTDSLIKLKIILPDIQDYELHLGRQRLLVFKASCRGKDYRLNIQLYDRVDNCQHSALGQHIRVTLTKCKSGEWERLCISPQRMRHIKFDVSQCVVPEETKKPFLKLNVDDDNLVINDGCEIVIGSDEDYSESDAESMHD